MCALRVESTRAGIAESAHRISLAVTDAEGGLVASSGDPDHVTFLRSAAKPFQALPLVEDGVVERFALAGEELAIACASHSSEPGHLAIVRHWLERLGLSEDDLACGPHRPLSRDLAHREPGLKIDEPARPWTRVTSNCSGKHTGMLTLALRHGWPTEGYHREGHPVQQRVEQAFREHAALSATEVGRGVDGCGVVSFAVPLRAMARAFASLVASDGEAERTIVRTMVGNPYLIGGTGRPDSLLMELYEGRVLTKVGAEGVFGAALVDRGVGLALKVEDGNAWAALVALVTILAQLGLEPDPRRRLPHLAVRPVVNTRGEQVGELRATGEIEFV